MMLGTSFIENVDCHTSIMFEADTFVHEMAKQAYRTVCMSAVMKIT